MMTRERAPLSLGRGGAELEAPSELDATRLVLDAVRLASASSRMEITRTTGLGRAAVAQRVAELLRLGLLEESGGAPSTGGRPPRRLSFRASAGYVLAADLGATSINVAAADLSARILHHRAEDSDIAHGPEAVLGRVEAMFDELLAESAAPGALWGIGIGIPGPVEFSTGRPVAPPIMPGWDGYTIRERFGLRFGVPVWVDNDVNTMALGEWRWGVARGHRDVVWVKIGTGIGSGLISDGAQHRGADGAAGDIGHIQVAEEGVVCRCGNIGCLEALAGGAALARDADVAARSDRSRWLAQALERDGAVTARSVALGACHGDPVCVGLLQRSGRLVGQVLASIVNFFNPSLIVIGGGLATSGDILLATIRETVYRRSLPLATRELRIVPSGLGELAGVIGASAMVVDQLLSRERFEETIGCLAA
ncbi:ROK family transcriptional regulator [soil metagenome]